MSVTTWMRRRRDVTSPLPPSCGQTRPMSRPLVVLETGPKIQSVLIESSTDAVSDTGAEHPVGNGPIGGCLEPTLGDKDGLAVMLGLTAWTG